MTNTEMTQLFASRMGYKTVRFGSKRGPGKEPSDKVWVSRHEHARDDELAMLEALHGVFASGQVMAAIEKFNMLVYPPCSKHGNGEWMAVGPDGAEGRSPLLNRAVVECVIRISKSPSEGDSR